LRGAILSLDDDQYPESRSEAMAEGTCPGCGMSAHLWTGNGGEGVPKDGQRYCCQGCADHGEAGCTCGEDAVID
jgi:hypothetical protein